MLILTKNLKVKMNSVMKKTLTLKVKKMLTLVIMKSHLTNQLMKQTQNQLEMKLKDYSLFLMV